MKNLLVIILLFISAFYNFSFSQSSIGDWQYYSSYNSPEIIEYGANKVYCVSNGNLFCFSEDDNSIVSYDKNSGLSDNNIAFIKFSDEMNMLVIVYSNGNIDLLSKGSVYNISDLKNKVITGDRTIVNLQIDNKQAYISCGFGTVIVNLEKKEIKESYFFGYKTTSAALLNDFIYIVCEKGVMKGNVNDNLSDLSKWVLFSGHTCLSITAFNGLLYGFYPSGMIMSYDAKSDTWKSIKYDFSLDLLKKEGSQIAFLSKESNKMMVLNENGTINTYSLEGSPMDISIKDNILWIGDKYKNLCSYKISEGSLTLINSDIMPYSINNKLPYYMTWSNERLFVAGGGKTNNRFDREGKINIFDNNNWHNISENDIKEYTDSKFNDVVHIAVDPHDNTHFYAFTWGEGIFEFKDDKFVNLFNYQNSNIETIYENNLNYHRVDGGTFDKDGNLWFLNSMVSKPLKVLYKDGTWKGFEINELKNHNSLGKIVITKNNHKWMNVLATGYGYAICVFNDNNTIDNTSDDLIAYITNIKYSDNGQPKYFTPSAVPAIAEDNNGAIWIGTDKGIFISSNPKNIFNDSHYFTRVKIPRNDGTGLADYLLESEKINVIAVDGGNRKWIGTQSSGVYLLNDTGEETIHHFTTLNSPLPSDNIYSIAIDDVTGEVYIGTALGLVSYHSDAIKADENYNDVYAYPNPVSSDYSGLITITGLTENSTVSITDISNNLVFRTKSVGGQATWNGLNAKGKRVSTGVYLVYANSSNCKKGAVTKIMFIK
ncbi:MAG: two-component regulator propeller domain-containing protein [Bacteroidales bacterium]|nr:two-component regulator propeller domain-containing protein [Bacteroidales bacterium]